MKAVLKETYKFLIFPVLGLSLMGNKGCDDKKEGRLLKMDVEIGSMRTLPLQVPDQEEIRIDQLTKNLFSRVIYKSNRFSIMNPADDSNPAIDPIHANSIKQNRKHSENDLELLSNYGFSNLGQNEFSIQAKTLESPTCQWESPQLILNSDVLGFELVNKAKLGLGYSPSGTHIDQLKGKVKFSDFRLDYGISAVNPLLNRLVASTEAVTHQNSVEVEFDFGQNSPITIDFFFQEALVKVVKEGIAKSLHRLVKRLSEQTAGVGKDWNQDVWESRVLLDPAICGADDCVAIRGGSLNQIKIGDRFKIYNMIHTWEGEPCQSRLMRSVPDVNASNEVVIESVGDTVSIARIETSESGVTVNPGAMVKLLTLNEPNPKDKKK